MEVLSSNHISAKEKEEVPQLEDTQEAFVSFEDGNQSMIDELKQVNLDTKQDPYPIFINVYLTSKEKRSYLDLLEEYRDVFA